MTILVSAQQKISLDALATKTRQVFELLAARPELADFVLIGGTAMALQMKHRLSEDLDFWLPDSQLKQSTIDRLMRDLVSLGHTCIFSTSPNDITKVRIAGIDLNSVVQDWTIDKVKVQFYCPDDVAKTIADVLKVGQLANPRNSPEAAKAVLRGQVPLDNSDEGFQALEANVSLQAIYSDFSTAIDLLEVEQARLVAIANQRRLSP
jgi:Nucleotidyl transferase AbiEii toxin, Type IV TA system